MLRVLGGKADKALRSISTSAVVRQEAKAAASSTGAVDPNDPIIAPSVIPWKQYKNEYYEKRGYKLANKDWTEWSDLPAPYKYLGVKVDPAHVEKQGLLWKFMSDWKTGVPATLFLAMPLYTSGLLPGFDERLELGLIISLASIAMFKEVGPMFKAWKKSAIEGKVKGLYDAEKMLNDEIAHASQVLQAGIAIPETIKTVHTAERALRKLEAEAATRKAAIAQRDGLVAELDYLVALKGQAAGETEGALVRTARAAVEGALEKDAKVQQASIEAAIKALTTGVPAEDVVAPLFDKAVAQAKAAAASKPAATTSPFSNPGQVEVFNKRFGYPRAARQSPISFVKA